MTAAHALVGHDSRGLWLALLVIKKFCVVLVVYCGLVHCLEAGMPFYLIDRMVVNYTGQIVFGRSPKYGKLLSDFL